MVLAGAPPFSHDFCPLRETRPGVPRDERFKSQPYFRAPHIHVATAARFCPGRQAIFGTAIQLGDVLKVDRHPDDPRAIVKNNVIANRRADHVPSGSR